MQIDMSRMELLKAICTFFLHDPPCHCTVCKSLLEIQKRLGGGKEPEALAKELSMVFAREEHRVRGRIEGFVGDSDCWLAVAKHVEHRDALKYEASTSNKMQQHFHCFAQNGVWGTCGECPRTASAVFPQFCQHFKRYDHQLGVESLTQNWKLYKRTEEAR